MVSERVRYWCADCKKAVSESEIHSVYRPGAGALVAHQGCGGQVLYYDPVEDGFFIALPQFVVGVDAAVQGDIVLCDEEETDGE